MITRTLALPAIVLLAASNAYAADLTITVTDIRSTKGFVGLSVADTAAAWDGKAKGIARQKLPIQGTEVVFRLTDLPPGQYAVSVIHDENENGKLDANFMGMPIEGYGFSNNPVVLRKPTFEEVKFQLGAEGGTMKIRLR